MLAEGSNWAPIVCHVCQQPAYISPPGPLTYLELLTYFESQRHVGKYWEARHVDDSPICQEGSTPC